MRRVVAPGVILIALVILHTPAWADRLEEMEKRLQIMGEQQQKLQTEQQKLLQEIERLKAEQNSIRKEQAKERLSEEELGEVAAGQAAPAQEEEKPPQVSLERALIERGGLLLRPGQLEITPAVDYNFFDTRRINVSGFSILPTLVIGVLETEKVQRNIVDPSLTLRLGVVEDVQADVRVPYRFTFDRISTETTETTRSVNGIGDIEGAVFYQPVREWGWIPDVIVGVRGKSRTGEDPFGGDPDELPLGTGFYSVTGSITGVKSSDPAVIFATVEYTHNFERTVRLLGTDPFKTDIGPGDSIGYNIGVALALNPELAINFRVEQRFVSETEIDPPRPGSTSNDVPGSTLNVATAFAGITWALGRTVSMDFSVGAGLTEDSPDVTVRLAFPIRFELFD
ncbi:MAG: transporter [Candidatus Methylomirabilales bacterium]